jgi:hypothetical protein
MCEQEAMYFAYLDWKARQQAQLPAGYAAASPSATWLWPHLATPGASSPAIEVKPATTKASAFVCDDPDA